MADPPLAENTQESALKTEGTFRQDPAFIACSLRILLAHTGFLILTTDFWILAPEQLQGKYLKQTYEPDFLCFGEIIVEIKAVKQLADEHRAQAINYLKATSKQLGLLINFGHYPKIEHERFVNQTLSRIPRIS